MLTQKAIVRNMVGANEHMIVGDRERVFMQENKPCQVLTHVLEAAVQYYVSEPDMCSPPTESKM